MNATYLQTNVDSLIDHMRAHGYSVAYIKQCRSVTNYIIRLADELSWVSYDDVRSWVSANGDFCGKYQENLQFAFNVIEQFDENQHLPVHPVNRKQMDCACHSAGRLDLLPLQQNMNEFEKSLQDKGHKPEYIKSIKAAAAKIIIAARTIPWDSFQEIQDYYQNLDKSGHTKRLHRLAIKKMEAFLSGGMVPCHRNAQHCLEDARPSLGELDLYELKDRLPELQKYMEEHQYSANYIRRTIIKTERIIVQSGHEAWDSYQDVIDWYHSQDYGPGFLKEMRTVIRLVSAFHLYGVFPNNRETQHPLWPRKNTYQQLIPQYRELVDYGCEAQARRGLKESSVDRARSEAAAFFYSMQIKGFISPGQISEDAVLGFFHTGTAGIHRTKIPQGLGCREPGKRSPLRPQA